MSLSDTNPGDDGRIIAPGGTVGIVGGGQLGRMTTLAAASLGYRCHIYCPDADNPAEQVADKATVAPYDDTAALDRFASEVDVITYEFENLPTEAFAQMGQKAPVRPHWRCLETTQHRAAEKDFVNAEGIGTAPYRLVRDAAELAAALDVIGHPAVLKTTRLGYDGKGQVGIKDGGDPVEAWAAMNGDEGILEGFVDFRCEVSAIIARGQDGATAAFDVVENRHANHILATTTVPASISGEMAREARAMAATLANALDLVGLLAVEMFVTSDDRLLVNELAARPHNSGHWTIDACHASQFEQFVRAVCGLPLGDPARHSDAVMTNLLGDDIDGWESLLGERDAHLHLYGKAEARPGRKMGHVTRVRPVTPRRSGRPALPRTDPGRPGYARR